MTNDELLDTADAIEQQITETPQCPSDLARKAGVTTSRAYEALRFLVRHDYVIAVGNGAWTKYRTRGFGERNARAAR